ncbi:beta-glucosidase BglX [Pontibacter sp. G13]|uniref:beta-glucosidase BglX n=1 Tax=Pontibacter sp. G13 TaxID=3074898 RepID=UPI00288C47B3|nr:beta-glucosidase BglX [Pontibacter sp. G13]WNJ20618.1 beta-glucosidase BglX [Pontibacter sp. G13]
MLNLSQKGWLLGTVALLLSACSVPPSGSSTSPQADARVEEILSQMTLEEKLGQLNLVVGDLFNTGPTVNTNPSDRFDEQIRQGQITGIFNIHGAEYLHRLQKIAVEETRLGIPLIFGADVIHGFRSVSPVPLAEAASWDLKAIEASARVAGEESAATGMHWTFAPMVDISRDARWGRIAEGAGEDPYLGSLVAAARVRGFQGEDLSAPNTIAACVKHFAAYGAPHGGRDYNTVDMSERLLREVFLPPYRAAIDAGAASLMTSFNELNGVPVTGSTWLLRDVLREEWGFNGMIVSDWQSITEMEYHGFAKDRAHSGQIGMEAGVDMDMMGATYLEDLPALVKSGDVPMELIDQAVRNVLQMKMDLGLFDDPFRYGSVDREASEIRNAQQLEAVRDMARKSMVLLKNEKNLLPLSKDTRKIALIGPLALESNKGEFNGCWSFFGQPGEVVSVEAAFREAMPASSKLLVAEGCDLYSDSQAGFKQAVKTAKQADVVVMVLGESAVMNGEGASRADIGLPGEQLALLKAVHATGKPLVVLTVSGRPLELSWLDENVGTILHIWTPGSETGHAVTDVVFGDYNPAGKLPVSFPRLVGQVPIYYNYKATGRMYEGDYSEHGSERVYRSRYRDVENGPLYPFGYGLSYTEFEYGEIRLDEPEMSMNGTLTASVSVTNTGKVAGEEVVQLYIRDLVGTATRPVKELKGFQKILLEPGESTTVSFEIGTEDLAFWHDDNTWYAEPGEFHLFIGTNSDEAQMVKFRIKDASAI